jgi:uncharacterized protein
MDSKGSHMTDQVQTRNKAVVTAFLNAVSDNDIDLMLTYIRDDATWWLSGRHALSGTYDKQQWGEMMRGVALMFKETPRFIPPFSYTAEDDRVAAEVESRGVMPDGRIYNNKYHLLFKVEDGLILELRDYMDTMHLYDIFIAGRDVT